VQATAFPAQERTPDYHLSDARDVPQLHEVARKRKVPIILKNLILQQRASRGLKEEQPIVIREKPHWTQSSVEECDLSLYDELMKEESV
jgi:hypothetical protein